jgi:pimeloyl-ACP methyl ester carboxylesterase
MKSIVSRVPGAAPDLHLVLLSGGFIAAADFEREGFIAALRARGVDCAVTIAEVRMAYFADGSIARRVGERVDAARAEHAKRIWIAGVSLGGLAALTHAAQDTDLTGLALFSPYPGTRPLLREIAAAGGLAAWAEEAQETDPERSAWLWLARRPERTPPVHAWYGSSDRFVEGQRLLAASLARDNVQEIAGGHDWPDWREMWRQFLETDSLR